MYGLKGGMKLGAGSEGREGTGAERGKGGGRREAHNHDSDRSSTHIKRFCVRGLA